jgi:hypothetical protein
MSIYKVSKVPSTIRHKGLTSRVATLNELIAMPYSKYIALRSIYVFSS